LNKELIKNKKINKGGSIVFISSISTKLGIPGTSIYASSKAALSTYAKVVASEISKQQIRSNIISPGIIKSITPNVETAIEISDKRLEEEYPFGFGSTSDVANLVAFLLSDLSRWITGSDIVIDGGYNLK
jgi:NAD(P)-dependent dehydrogenase (short-subunit alcohol dehydrogenase family)